MTEKRVLNIALVGTGGMARSYRHRYTQVEGACLKLLVDVNEELARTAAQELKVERWSSRFEDALAPDIDIVDISTPNHLHAQQAIAAMKAGKHVLLQKPIAPTVKEAEEIVEASKQTGRKVGMYMSMFDNPIYHDLKRMAEQGYFGAISGVRCRDAHKGGLRMQEGNWRNSAEKTGGGSFIQLAIHPVNMVQYLLNDKAASVMAFSKNLMCPNVGGDDVTAAACEFESGILGTFESAYCAEQNILEIFGTKGFVRVIDNREVFLKLEESYEGEAVKYSNPGQVESLVFDTPGLSRRYNKYDQHIAFVEAVKQDAPAPIPVAVGLYDLKIVQAVYRSAREKRCVSVAEIRE